MTNTEKKRETHTMPAVTQTRFELMKGFMRDEKRESQVLRVVSGTAWVTMDDKDFVLQEGDEVRLSRGKYGALVSTIGDEPLVYEVKD